MWHGLFKCWCDTCDTKSILLLQTTDKFSGSQVWFCAVLQAFTSIWSSFDRDTCCIHLIAVTFHRHPDRRWWGLNLTALCIYNYCVSDSFISHVIFEGDWWTGSWEKIAAETKVLFSLYCSAHSQFFCLCMTPADVELCSLCECVCVCVCVCVLGSDSLHVLKVRASASEHFNIPDRRRDRPSVFK